MDWDATDKTGILRDLNQCRIDLQLRSGTNHQSVLNEFPDSVLMKRYYYNIAEVMAGLRYKAEF